ncbi:unnamed protein product [Durusdinium trenchii]|uniref:Uncharacterized protein n=1 Tax=Durusdinium trenchii TaxID=1381693 RepID=A0ABP0NHJ6_9DINO
MPASERLSTPSSLVAERHSPRPPDIHRPSPISHRVFCPLLVDTTMGMKEGPYLAVVHRPMDGSSFHCFITAWCVRVGVAVGAEMRWHFPSLEVHVQQDLVHCVKPRKATRYLREFYHLS